VHHIDIAGLQLAAQHFTVNHILAATEGDDIYLVFL